MIERRKNRFVVGMRSAKERIMGTASDAGTVVTDRVQGVGEGLADTAGSAVDTVRGAPDAVRQQAQGNPMMAGAVAFGVGFLVAAAFPPSRTEEQLAEQAMDRAEPLKQQLMESGQEVAEHLKESATEAVEQVKQTATEGAGQVADTAKEASQTTKDAVRDAAETARQEATSS
jgi:gas vesicle protein